MKGAIMQPTLFPWVGYFAMIDDVDKFIFLDNVQLVKRSWQVRNRIKQNDKELMLHIPIINTKRSELLINNAKISYAEDWKKKHLESIKHSYSKAKYYKEVYEIVNEIYEREFEYIGDFTIDLILAFVKYIGITTEISRSSEIEGIQGKKDELLVEICKKKGITEYLSAKGSAVYIEQKQEGGAFAANGLGLEYQSYEHPIYHQLGNEFIPYMGIIDLLFNEGKNSLEVIRSGNRQSLTSKEVVKGF